MESNGRKGNLNESLLYLSQKYHKSIAQIILRWLFQRKIISVVKTTNFKRMKENLDIFDFKISAEDMETIAELDTKQSCFGARTNGCEVERFLEEAKKYNV